MEESDLIELANGHQVPRPLSYSRIDKFLSCPLQYKYKYVEGKDGMSAPPLRVGIAVHECLEYYVEYLLENNLEQDVDYMEELTYDQQLPADEWNEMHNIAVNFAKMERFDPPYNSPEIEADYSMDKNFNQCEYDDDDVVMRLIIDLLHETDQGDLIITDYKTNRRVLSQTELDDHLQLELYAWVMSKLRPDVDMFQVNLWFVRYGSKLSRIITRREIENSIEDKIMGFFDSITEAELNEEFEAQISSNCSWCSYNKICPEYVDRREAIAAGEFEPDDNADAQELAEHLKMATRIRQDLRNDLKSYVENTEESIELSDQELSFHPRKVDKFYNLKRLFIKLKELGMDVDDAWECFKISKQDLKSKLKEEGLYNAYEDLVDEIAREETKTQFGFKNIND